MNKIKKYRKLKNKSQADISKELKVTQNAISQWETGVRNPSLNNALKLAEILETTVEELYKK